MSLSVFCRMFWLAVVCRRRLTSVLYCVIWLLMVFSGVMSALSRLMSVGVRSMGGRSWMRNFVRSGMGGRELGVRS